MSDRLQARLRTALAGKYDVGDTLGVGGMAYVYQARDLNPHRPRQVAVKVLKPDLASELGEERFLREIHIAARLVHPHILPLFDSDSADGLLYYVMPYVDGETLRGRLDREHQLPVETALRIAANVAEALAYAHSRGVIHRDIKPENILFAAGAPIVADFGIARAVAAASPDREAAPTPGSERPTEPGLTVGTPCYMSPEQALGQADLDGRSDVYSLGCVLYEMLAGAVPFPGLNRLEVVSRQLMELPVSLRGVRTGIPESLERVVFRALARKPEDRFTTAADFHDALTARATPAPGVTGQSVAVLPFANLSGDPAFAYLGEGIAEDIIMALAHVRGLQVAARTSSVAARMRGLDLQEIGARLGVATVLEGSVQKSGNQLRVAARLAKAGDGFQLWTKSYEGEMTDVFDIQDKIAKGVAAGLELTLKDWEGKTQERALVTPPTAHLGAYDLYLRGRYELAQRGLGLKRALGLFGQAVALDPTFAPAHAGVAEAYVVLAQYGLVPPDAIRTKARAAADRALELAPDLAEAHCASGALSLVCDWDWTRASAALQRAVELNPQYVGARIWLAFYLVFVQGRLDDGIAQAQRAVDLDPLAPLPAMQLGMTLLGAGRYADAGTALRRASELDSKMFLPHLHLGLLHSHLGRPEDAVAAFELAIAGSGRHPWALSAIAVCYRAMGMSGEVQAIHDELVARARYEYVQSCMLAVLAASLGRMDDAFQLLERACDEHDGILIYAKRYPFLSVLQTDPRMQGIFERVGFPEHRPARE